MAEALDGIKSVQAPTVVWAEQIQKDTMVQVRVSGDPDRRNIKRRLF